MDTNDFLVSDTLLGTCNFGNSEGFFLQLINFRVKPRRKKTAFWWKVGTLTPTETLNCQNLPKSLCRSKIMVIVSSFGHNRHLFIHKSIQNLVQSGKMGSFEL